MIFETLTAHKRLTIKNEEKDAIEIKNPSYVFRDDLNNLMINDLPRYYQISLELTKKVRDIKKVGLKFKDLEEN